MEWSEEPIERDGSPVREWAFWLRDLRHRSGYTYRHLARATHYSKSTLQAAAGGRQLPPLRVAEAFVAACGGDADDWRAYWSQIKRALDSDPPAGVRARVKPPWAQSLASLGDEPEGPVAGAAPAGPGQAGAASGAPDGWYVESFHALVWLGTPQPQALERRVIVATVDGLTELATSVSVPRHEEDGGPDHTLHAEVLSGGSLEVREQPYESYFRHVIALPAPLAAGERHEYQMLLRVPRGQPLVPHYVYVPFCRSDRFDLRVRFSPERLPEAVWMLSGTPPAVIYEREPDGTVLTPDHSGSVHAQFRDLQVGRGYGVRWRL